MLAPKELRDVHPLGKAPIISDDGLVIAESGQLTRSMHMPARLHKPRLETPIFKVRSGAIVEYLIDTYGNGRFIPPSGAKQERIQYSYWMHFAEGSAMLYVVLTLLATNMVTSSPWFLRPLVRLVTGGLQSGFTNPNLKRNAEYMEKTLRDHQWFAGNEFTGADVIMSFPVEAMMKRGNFGDKYPKLASYLDNIHNRPAYKRAEERGGKLQLL